MHSDSSLPLSKNCSRLSLRTVWRCKSFLEMLRQCWHLIDTKVFRSVGQTEKSKNCCRSCNESLTQKLFCQVQIFVSDHTAAVGDQCSCTSLYVKRVWYCFVCLNSPELWSSLCKRSSEKAVECFKAPGICRRRPSSQIFTFGIRKDTDLHGQAVQIMMMMMVIMVLLMISRHVCTAAATLVFSSCLLVMSVVMWAALTCAFALREGQCSMPRQPTRNYGGQNDTGMWFSPISPVFPCQLSSHKTCVDLFIAFDVM